MRELAAIIDDLHELRAVFGVLDDDYRQGRLDVAIDALETLEEDREEFESVGAWEKAVTTVEEEYDVPRLTEQP